MIYLIFGNIKYRMRIQQKRSELKWSDDKLCEIYGTNDFVHVRRWDPIVMLLLTNNHTAIHLPDKCY